MEYIKPAMIVLGFLAIAFGLFTRLRNRGLQNWPSVSGTIIRSDLQTTADGKTRLAAAFRYQIDERVIDSRMIILTIEDVRPAVVYRILQRLAPGSRVKVYYDPKDPASATVDHTPRGNWLEAVLAGMALVTYAAFGL
ncbi:MAG: DUF3592 domain-containing protein [Dechloromonas sp.]|jgi:hypothetical protein|nr:DUF3592 domain-containing protein [Dechloromonas sp.]